MEISQEYVLSAAETLDSGTIPFEEKLRAIKDLWDYSCETGTKTKNNTFIVIFINRTIINHLLPKSKFRDMSRYSFLLLIHGQINY